MELQEFLKVQDIVEKYQAGNGEVLALDGVSFTVRRGEFISIVGPSGCGKSTLLSIIAGLEKPTYGTVLLGGDEIHGIDSRIGYMLQNDNLLDWKSIFHNILLGLKIQKKLSSDNLSYGFCPEKRVFGCLFSDSLSEYRG